jgi:hypothetical protein
LLFTRPRLGLPRRVRNRGGNTWLNSRGLLPDVSCRAFMRQKPVITRAFRSKTRFSRARVGGTFWDDANAFS